MEIYKKKVINLISNLLLEYKPDPTVVPHYPAKTQIMHRDRHPLMHGTPEAHGISSSSIISLLRALENEPRTNVHSIVITKDGVVIAEASAPGYDATLPHLSHSMSKTVTGLLIESLIDSGKLSLLSRAIDFFPEITPKDERIYDLTVEHLLTMSSGASFAEVGSVSSTDWTRDFFESELIFSPGEEFIYNSMNSYVLMHIADRIAARQGASALDLVQKHIFEPMGIKNLYWEMSPEGVPKGGWGLYLSCESWARLGIMVMQGGVYNGRRILSEEAVKRTTSMAISVPREISEHDYGHQLWVDASGDLLFNGMLGQNVWICPKKRIVVAMTSGNRELMQGTPAIKLMREHLCSTSEVKFSRNTRELERKCKDFFTSREWITLHAPLRGLPYLLGLKSRTPFDTALLPLIGKYLLPTNNLSLLPSFVSVMQNNYSGGIRSAEFSRCGEVMLMRMELGCDIVDIALGIYNYTDSTVVQRGEHYLVRGAISADTDGGGKLIYKIDLIFPELPNTRRIRLSLSADGRLNMCLCEMPGKDIAPDLMRVVKMSNPRTSSLFSMIERTLGRDFMPRKMGELFTPEITAISTSAPDADTFLAEENERIMAKVNSSRLVRSILARFADDGDEDQAPTIRTKMSDIFNRFKRK